MYGLCTSSEYFLVLSAVSIIEKLEMSSGVDVDVDLVVLHFKWPI